MARRPQNAPIRNLRSLTRRQGNRMPGQVMLIACEGETELYYFRALRDHHRLTRAEIIIPEGAPGNDPLGLVEYAERQAHNTGGYDYIYCVFDRDSHARFVPAREMIRQLAARQRKRLPISEGVAIPCFEIWVLQHFQQNDRPFANADEVIEFLKAGPLPGYGKADAALARSLVTRIDTAIRNAKWLVDRNRATDSVNPSTNLHQLAEKIAEMAAVR